MWTLRNVTTGQSKSLGEWGFEGFVKRTASQAVGTVTFFHIVQRVKDAPPISYGDVVSISDGRQWFYGVCTSVPRVGSGPSESNSYTISDPWYWLDRVVAQQEWPGVTPGLTTRWLFNLSDRADPPSIAAGTHITSGEQIRNLLDDINAAALTDFGAPILTQGEILSADETVGDPEAVKPQIIERRDVTYSEAIRDQLRYIPGAATWFDSSTTPPTLHIRDVSHMDTVNLQMTQIERADLDPQYHLQRDAVVLRYEIVSTVNGAARLSLSTDKYPLNANEESMNGYVQTIDLRGPSISITTGTIVVNTIAITDINWWLVVNPELTHDDVVSVAFTPGTTQRRTGTLGLPYCVLRGAIADWMLVGAIAGRVEEEIVYCSVTITTRVLSNGVPTGATTTTERKISTRITATDLPSDTYSSRTTVADGDPQPVGLAKALYDFWSVLQFAGRITIKANELPGVLRVGQKVNIIGSVPEWETMGAVIQAVTENIDSGVTEIEVGPVNKLGVQDTIDLLR